MSLLSRGETSSELTKVSEFGADLNLRTIHKDRKDRLGGAGIVDDLIRKEELWVIVCQRLGLVGLWNPLEEEDEAVDGSMSQRSDRKVWLISFHRDITNLALTGSCLILRLLES